MADKKVTVDEMLEAVQGVLGEYAEEVTEGVNRAAVSSALSARDELRNKSPKRTGRYARSWNVKTTENARNGVYTSTVYNKKYYRLTHLLEHGFAHVHGDRFEGVEHIKPAEQNAVRQFTQKVEEAIKNG